MLEVRVREFDFRSWDSFLASYSVIATWAVVNSSIRRQNRSNDHVPILVHNSHV